MTLSTESDPIRPPPAPPRAAPAVNRPLVFAIVALTLLMMSVDSTIVATVLHDLQLGLDTTVTWAGWTLTAYSLGFVLMLPISGRLSAHFGRRRVFLASVAMFTLASLLCGLADDIRLLVVLRALQAAGGAGFTPSATGIIVDHFGDARDRAVSLFGSIFPIGAMIGPIFGGLIAEWFSWRGVFFVNLPIGLAVLVLALRFIPADPPRARAPGGVGLDLPGMALMGVATLGFMAAAAGLGDAGLHPATPAFLLPVLACLLATVLFLRHVARSPRPFIAPAMIHGAAFGPVNLVNAIYGGSLIGIMSLVPLYAMTRYGFDALEAGTLLIAQGVATVAASVSAALLLRRTGHRAPIRLGGCVAAVGLVLLALAPPWGLGVHAWLAGSALLVGLGGGMLNPASRNAGLQLAPQQSSTLAALRSLFLQLGAIATISLVTAVLGAARDAAHAQALSFVALAVLLVLALPIIRRVPEHHGAW